jgi:hypothetical protein
MHVGACVAINAKGGDCWQIFNRQRMLVIDGKYDNEDRHYREDLNKLRRDSAEDCWQE